MVPRVVVGVVSVNHVTKESNRPQGHTKEEVDHIIPLLKEFADSSIDAMLDLVGGPVLIAFHYAVNIAILVLCNLPREPYLANVYLYIKFETLIILLGDNCVLFSIKAFNLSRVLMFLCIILLKLILMSRKERALVPSR